MTVDLSTAQGRRREFHRLLRFASGSVPAANGPFGYLNDRGEPDPSQGYPLWVTARMTHVFGLAVLLGLAEAAAVEKGVAALADDFSDDDYGGWFPLLDEAGSPVADSKAMYEHAFVVLAAATATAAGVAGAPGLLERALGTVEEHFWDEQAGACRESFARDWSSLEPYRGANSNMHAVEAFLAASWVLDDPVWSGRAARIAERIAHCGAASLRWRLAEHYGESWEVDLDYNQDDPADRFRPFGVTVGHLLEWSRLLVHLDAASPGTDWLVSDARRLFDTATRIGWAADGEPGFVYTLDWDDRPVIAERMHWVAVEAAMAANALARRTGLPGYAAWEDRIWRAASAFVDEQRGGWHHELSPDGKPSAVVWSGKPDVYHAAQAVLFPDLPLTPALVGSAASAGGLW